MGVACSVVNESIEHIFYQCDYAMWILKGAMEVMGEIIEPRLDATIETFADQLESIGPKTPAWGHVWTLLAILSWSVWHERNNMLKHDTHCPKEVILHQVIKTTTVYFKETKI